jgi:hypothetical protein
MLDEERGLFAIGDTIVKFSEWETAILRILCIKYQRIAEYKEGEKYKLDDLVTAEEMQRAIHQMTKYDIAMTSTEATRSRVAKRLRWLGFDIKKQPRAGYYLKDMHYIKKRR